MRIHIVTAGDSVYQLAQRYRVSVARIISDNGLLYPYTLVVGQALIILRPKTTHTVQEGESPYSIALRYGLTVQELYQNNPVLADRTPLYPGQELSISFEGQKTRGLAILGYAYPFVNRHVLRRAMPFLTYLAVFSYGLRLDGSLVIPDDAELLRYAQLYQSQAVMVLSSIGDDGSFSEQITRVLLSDRAFQDRALDSLIAQMLQKGYRGLDSDFEYIPPELADAYLSFLENASARLHTAGLFLHCALAPKTSAQQAGLLYESHRYHEIGAIADRVLLMTYEWGYTAGPAMPVAPLPEVRRVLEYGVSEIPPEKIFMGLPNYGYVWREPYVAGQSRAQSIGNQEAILIAARQGVPIEYDQRAQSPFFRFRRSGALHQVWFEDVRSMEQKFLLCDELALLGGGYWNLMRPFAQNWALLSARYYIKKLGLC